jgi:hypothetical protein
VCQEKLKFLKHLDRIRNDRTRKIPQHHKWGPFRVTATKPRRVWTVLVGQIVIINGQQPTWSPNFITLEKKWGRNKLFYTTYYYCLTIISVCNNNNNNNNTRLLCNITSLLFKMRKKDDSRSQWPRGLKRGSAAIRLLGLRVRIPPEVGRLSVVSVVCGQVEVLVSG